MVEGQLRCVGGGSKRSEDGYEDGWRTARWRERGVWWAAPDEASRADVAGERQRDGQ